MDSKYLRLEPEEAFWIKKQIKFSGETFGNILNHILTYQSLRKKEVIIKNKLKVSMTQLKSKITQMESSFPEEERKDAYDKIYEKERGTKKIHHANRIPQLQEHHEIPRHLSHLHNQIKRQQTNPDEDLEDIKRKLERLQR